MFSRFRDFLADFQTKATPLSSAGALDLFAPPAGASGVSVNAETALRVPALAQGVAVISRSIGVLDVAVYRDGPSGREKVADHPAARVLKQPNAWTGETRMKTQLVADTLLHGNGLLLVSRVRAEVRELHRLDPRSVTIDADTLTGMPVYRVTMADGATVEYGAGDIVHLRGPSVDGLRGLGVVDLAREAIALALLLETHAARLFSSGAKPGGVLQVPGRLDQAVLDRLRASFNSRYSGPSGAGRTMILENGVTFQAAQLTSVDAEFSACRAFQVVEIARALNLSPILLGDLSRATFNNSAEMRQAFLDATLLPVIEDAEDEFERVLLTPQERDAGYAIEFDTTNFVRADLEKRFAALKTGIESGVYTLNEARATEGLPPIEGGDQAMRSVQVMPIDAPATDSAP